jgi:hypothetical protein
MRKMFKKFFPTLASIPSQLENSDGVGASSVAEDPCEGEFDSSKCPRHPDNEGGCPHHDICDKLKEWEGKNRVSETEMVDRVQHGERVVNGTNNPQVRSGKYGVIAL